MSEENNSVKDAAPESPGAMLFRLRMARQLSLTEVAQNLKYGERQIEALESDDFSKLPGMTFVRGMIRGYAKLLGADPELILRELGRQSIADPVAVNLHASQIPFPDGKKRTTHVYAALSLMLIVIAALIGYGVSPWPFEFSTAVHDLTQRTDLSTEGVEDRQEIAAISNPSNVPTIPSIAPIADSPQVPVVEVLPVRPEFDSSFDSGRNSNNKKIALQFDRDSWVEIKQGNGKTLLSQLNPAGTTQVVEGIPPFVLIIGNAPNVHLSYNDQPVDLRPYFKIDVARLTLE
jgi:cytoskeleton protein RodZ